jgi:hypothetical protein
MRSASLDIENLRSLAALLDELTPSRLELRQFDYSPEFFGSFELHLGTGHRRLKFVWDGREDVLSLSSATLSSKGDVPAWRNRFDLELPFGSGLWENIASSALDVLQSNISLQRDRVR